MLNDLTISQILMRFAAVVIIAGIHGAAVAGTAVLLGDKGSRYDGRLTVLPTAHLDILGTLAAVVFGMGWTRQVAIDSSAFRAGRAAAVLVVLAGTVALLLTALGLLALVRPALEGLSYSAGISVSATLRIGARICVSMAILNLVPIPPLTGAHLLAVVGVSVPKKAVWVGTAVLLALLATGVIQSLLTPVFHVVAPLVLGAEMSGR